MTPTAQQLNEWLSANAQDAIKSLQEQGLTLRFVEGPENWWQEYPSLAVGSEGVGFTFQQSCRWSMDPFYMIQNATDKASELKDAFDVARTQYGTNKLPMESRSVGAIRGERWDICNHQDTCSAFARNSQEKHWRSEFLVDGDWDAPKLVQELCANQSFFDSLESAEFIVQLSRSDDVSFKQNPDVHLSCKDGNFGFRLHYSETPTGCAIECEAMYYDAEFKEFFSLMHGPTATLAPHGVNFEVDDNEPVCATLNANHLDMDPLMMNTMADMGMSPVELIRFDAQKAQAETAIGDEYLASLDGNVFASDEAQQEI